MELEEIRRKKFTSRDGEENQEINDIPVIEKRIWNENGSMEPNETDVCTYIN